MFLAVLDWGWWGEKLSCSLFEIPCNFTGEVPVLRETGIWICYISSWIFFFLPSYLYSFLVWIGIAYWSVKPPKAITYFYFSKADVCVYIYASNTHNDQNVWVLVCGFICWVWVVFFLINGSRGGVCVLQIMYLGKCFSSSCKCL